MLNCMHASCVPFTFVTLCVESTTEVCGGRGVLFQPHLWSVSLLKSYLALSQSSVCRIWGLGNQILFMMAY